MTWQTAANMRHQAIQLGLYFIIAVESEQVNSNQYVFVINSLKCLFLWLGLKQ